MIHRLARFSTQTAMISAARKRFRWTEDERKKLLKVADEFRAQNRRIDWSMVSESIGIRSPGQCNAQYHYLKVAQEARKFSLRPWTVDEDNKLLHAANVHDQRGMLELRRFVLSSAAIDEKELVKRMNGGKWTTISLLFNNRPGIQCLSRYNLLQGSTVTPRPFYRWSEEEKALLRFAVQEYGEDNWEAVSERVKSRTPRQCRNQWNSRLKPGVVLTPWTEEEKRKLFKLVKEHGNAWSLISGFLPGRTRQQCRVMFTSFLKPPKSKTRNYSKRVMWTPEEDHKLRDALALYAHEMYMWKVISQNVLPHRTPSALRNRYNSNIKGSL